MKFRPLPINCAGIRCPFPNEKTDFVDGIVTLGGNGDPAMQTGVAIHLYAANASMQDRFFYTADGELLIVPQLGALRFHTELGILDVAPGEICVIPRGIKFRVVLAENQARGYICENYGLPFRLPELGPIGANGLANPRDFKAPVAAFEDRDGEFHITVEISRPPLVRRSSITRRSTSSPGTATTRPTNTTWRSSTASTPSPSTTPTRPSTPC